MLKKLFINQIAYLIDNTVSDEMYLSALRYVSDELKKSDDIDKIVDLLRDWRHDCCVRCDNCGNYCLNEDVQCRYGCYFCCDKCVEEWYQDEEYDEATNRELQSMRTER